MGTSAELTEVLDDVIDGGPEQRIHGIWTHPQHSLGRPLNKVHTAKKKNKEEKEKKDLPLSICPEASG